MIYSKALTNSEWSDGDGAWIISDLQAPIVEILKVEHRKKKVSLDLFEYQKDKGVLRWLKRSAEHPDEIVVTFQGNGSYAPSDREYFTPFYRWKTFAVPVVMLICCVFGIIANIHKTSSSQLTNEPTTSQKSTIPGAFKDDDIKIGRKYWTQKNLDVDTFLDGTTIIQVTSRDQWQRCNRANIPCWCYYQNDPDNAKYGRIYNKAVVSDISHKGIIPAGYRFPEINDLQNLRTDGIGAHSLKSLEGWNNTFKYGNGNNMFGPNIFPGGYCSYDFRFSPEGSKATFWLRDERTEERGTKGELLRCYYGHIQNTNDSVNWDDESMNSGFYIRLVRRFP